MGESKPMEEPVMIFLLYHLLLEKVVSVPMMDAVVVGVVLEFGMPERASSHV